MKNNLVLLTMLLALFSCQSPQPYKFAVICDTRSDANNSGKSGVNVAAVEAVCHHLQQSGAEFVIAPGDFICGNVSWYDTLAGPPSNHIQYQAFLQAAQSAGVTLPGKGGKILLYPVRGNHECYQQILPQDSISAAWTENIGNFLPTNGPADEIGFTYSFKHNGSLFLALDQYVHADASKKKGISVDQQWIDQTLEKNAGADHVFAFGHTPAFAAKHQDCLGEDSVARNTFLRSIADRSGVYFCGHDHFYARAEVPVYGTDGSVETYMQQVITPSGAPFLGGFSPKWNGVYKNKDVKAEQYKDETIGYQLVTVTGNRVHVQFIATTDGSTHTVDSSGVYHYTYNDDWKTWNFTTVDEFSYELSN